jgi:asparagine synthase (glutamine-hydrolysing)
MMDELVHRGPDDSGHFETEGVALGHRRLSIIDLSTAGRQPMANEDGTCIVVFNGEIYNFKELRPQLEGRGHRFRSHTDTEVILHAYEEWGLDCLSKFVGMFAFALYDSRQAKLLLARDHLGVKPLYFYRDAGRLLFASEMKAIQRVCPQSKSPNYAAIYDFVTLSRFDHDETTSFAGIQQVRPGHFLQLELGRESEAEQVRYWTCTPEEAADTNDYSNPTETFRRMFDESVALQLRSDVPVGVFLSGGLDSSAILTTAGGLTREKLQTFSVWHAGPEYDEQHYAEAVLSQCDVECYDTRPNSDKLATDMRAFIRAQEVPTNGPGPFSEWCVSELARGRVKVLLSGQGPDEMLGGYHHHFEPYVRSRYEEIVSTRAWSQLSEFYREIVQISRCAGRSVLYYLAAAGMSRAYVYKKRARRAVNDRLLLPELRQYGKEVLVESEEELAGATPLDRALGQTLMGWGIARLLHYADRNTMNFSLEARVPFLDHRLVEYCMGLPYRMKIRGHVTKHILRESMQERVPATILERTDKKGYPTPIGAWLRQQEPFVRQVMDPATLTRRRVLEPKVVQRLIDRHMTGRVDNGWTLWQLLNLELWLQEFVD